MTRQEAEECRCKYDETSQALLNVMKPWEPSYVAGSFNRHVWKAYNEAKAGLSALAQHHGEACEVHKTPSADELSAAEVPECITDSKDASEYRRVACERARVLAQAERLIGK